MTRPTLHVVMMANALVWASRSTCSSRVSVGAVLSTADGRTVSTGYNGSPAGQLHCNDIGCDFVDGHCIRAVHAEENVILNCAREGISSHGTTLYITHSPCARCCKRIIQAGVREVMYLNEYGDSNAAMNELNSAGVQMHRLSSNERKALNELLRALCEDNYILGK